MRITCHSNDSTTCNIVAGQNVFAAISEFLEQYRQQKEKIFVLVDRNTRQHCLPILLSNVPGLQFSEILEIEEGEESKSIQTAISLWENLSMHSPGRNTLLINLGGGVVSDLGGFVASTYKRGIPYINIPTSLMGMVDAAIGGKTGINEGKVKNQIGTFTLPAGVFIFPGFLSSLPAYHVKSGYGEIIKYALIADPDLWEGIKCSHFSEFIAHPFDESQWNFFIHKSIQIKTGIVNSDFTEKGSRALLNFGHTIGHAMESLSMTPGHRALSHGHAIALGMICESYLSVQKTGLPKQVLEEITAIILADFDHFRLSAQDITRLVALLLHDKKRTGEEVRFSLIENPGKAHYGIPCSNSLVMESIDYYNLLAVSSSDHNTNADKIPGK